MSRLKVIIAFSILVGFAVLVLCRGVSQSMSMSAAEQVVRDFFKWHNKKDLSRMESLLSKAKKGITWELDKLEYVKLLSIHEDKSGIEKRSYLTHGRGTDLNPFDVKVFKVKFQIKFKGGFGSGMEDGEYDWNYILIKEKRESPWLIDDWGV